MPDALEAILNDALSPRMTCAGLVGVGRLGTRIRQILEARGLAVLLYDPPRAFEEASDLGESFFQLWGNGMGGCQLSNEGMETFLPLSSLAKAQLICVQVPLVTEGPQKTTALINQDFLNQCAPDTVILCFSPLEVVAAEAQADARIRWCVCQ